MRVGLELPPIFESLFTLELFSVRNAVFVDATGGTSASEAGVGVSGTKVFLGLPSLAPSASVAPSLMMAGLQ